MYDTSKKKPTLATRTILQTTKRRSSTADSSAELKKHWHALGETHQIMKLCFYRKKADDNEKSAKLFNDFFRKCVS